MQHRARYRLRSFTAGLVGATALAVLIAAPAANAGPVNPDSRQLDAGDPGRQTLASSSMTDSNEAAAAGVGSIAGTIQPVDAHASVSIYSASVSQFTAVAQTDPTSGEYSVNGLAPGTYRMQVYATSSAGAAGGYLSTWFDSAADFATATDIVVTDGGVTQANETLEAAALVEGSLYNVSATGTETLVTDPDTAVSFYPDGSSPGADDARQVYAYGGSYSSQPLPAGTYNVAFGSLATGFGNAGFSTKQYYDRAGTDAAATPVTVEAGELRENVNAYYAELVSRLAGPNRYATSAAISKDTFKPGVPVAYIANGLNFPDALSASAIAGPNGGPILLTAPTSLPSEITSELGRLNPDKIVVLGSNASVSDAVFAALDGYTTGSVTRLAGPNRFATSAAISRSQFAGSDSVPVAYVSNGFKFPDALSASAIAGVNGGPILLVGPDSIPAEIAAELELLNPDKIVVLGSSASVSAAVFTTLGTYTDGSVSRLQGANRYATSAAISASQFAPGVPVAYVTNGEKFPDALSASAIAGNNGGPILLVGADAIPGEIADELGRLNPSRIVVLGSAASVSDAVFAQLHDYVD